MTQFATEAPPVHSSEHEAEAPVVGRYRPPAWRWWYAALGLAALAVVSPYVWSAISRPLLPAGAGSAAVSRGGPSKGVGPRVDYEAPNIRLKDPTGKTVELKQFRGQAVLLNFWATWCTPCREELPELEQLSRQYKDRGLVVLAVSIDDDSSAKHVPEFLKAGDDRVGSYTFPVVLDTKQETARTFKLLGIPSSFFIDPTGVIRSVQPRVMNRQTILEHLGTIFDLPPGAV